MKKLSLIAALALLIGCGESTTPTAENSKLPTTIVADFLENTSSIENSTEKQPIVAFNQSAKDKADKEMNLNKETIHEVLKQALKFKHTVIVVEDHTLLKILDIEDCKASGSWSACMPMASGYIKKGKLVEKEDYINNLIGLPDKQKRTAYFFN